MVILRTCLGLLVPIKMDLNYELTPLGQVPVSHVKSRHFDIPTPKNLYTLSYSIKI